EIARSRVDRSREPADEEPAPERALEVRERAARSPSDRDGVRGEPGHGPRGSGRVAGGFAALDRGGVAVVEEAPELAARDEPERRARLAFAVEGGRAGERAVRRVVRDVERPRGDREPELPRERAPAALDGDRARRGHERVDEHLEEGVGG